MQIRCGFQIAYIQAAGIGNQAAQLAGRNFAQVLAEAVAAVVSSRLAVLYDPLASQGQTVRIEHSAADTTGVSAGHGDANLVAGGVFLDIITFFEKVGVRIDCSVIEIGSNRTEQFGNFQFLQNHLARAHVFRGHSLAAGFDFLKLAGDLTGNGIQIQGAEIVLMVQFHALLFICIGGDGLQHGIKTHLGFLHAPAVAHGLGMAVDEHLYAVEGCVFQGIGRKHRLAYLHSKIHPVCICKIAGNLVGAFLIGRQFVGSVADEQRLFHRLFDQILQLILGGRGIDKELSIAYKFPMAHVDGNFLVAGVGAAYSFQLALDKEQLCALLAVEIDLIIADAAVGAQHFYDISHPNFTFTFRAGPPSLTRTHSL